LPKKPEAQAYTEEASTGSRGPAGYGAILTGNGKTEEISGGEQSTTNQRMEVTAVCIALQTIDRGTTRDRLLRLVLPRQLHEEGLVQEVARERVAQATPWFLCRRGFLCQAGALQDRRRPAHERERPEPTSSPWPPRRGPTPTQEEAVGHLSLKEWEAARDLLGKLLDEQIERAFGLWGAVGPVRCTKC
jgi:RNase H